MMVYAVDSIVAGLYQGKQSPFLVMSSVTFVWQAMTILIQRFDGYLSNEGLWLGFPFSF